MWDSWRLSQWLKLIKPYLVISRVSWIGTEMASETSVIFNHVTCPVARNDSICFVYLVNNTTLTRNPSLISQTWRSCTVTLQASPPPPRCDKLICSTLGVAGRCGQLAAKGVSVLLVRSCLHVGGLSHRILFQVCCSSSFSLVQWSDFPCHGESSPHAQSSYCFAQFNTF
jgi:hypothetical protein